MSLLQYIGWDLGRSVWVLTRVDDRSDWTVFSAVNFDVEFYQKLIRFRLFSVSSDQLANLLLSSIDIRWVSNLFRKSFDLSLIVLLEEFLENWIFVSRVAKFVLNVESAFVDARVVLICIVASQKTHVAFVDISARAQASSANFAWIEAHGRFFRFISSCRCIARRASTLHTWRRRRSWISGEFLVVAYVYPRYHHRFGCEVDKRGLNELSQDL